MNVRHVVLIVGIDGVESPRRSAMYCRDFGCTDTIETRHEYLVDFTDNRMVYFFQCPWILFNSSDIQLEEFKSILTGNW